MIFQGTQFNPQQLAFSHHSSLSLRITPRREAFPNHPVQSSSFQPPVYFIALFIFFTRSPLPVSILLVYLVLVCLFTLEGKPHEVRDFVLSVHLSPEPGAVTDTWCVQSISIA